MKFVHVLACCFLAGVFAAGCIWPGQERVTGPVVQKESTVLGPDGKPAVCTVTRVEGPGYQGRRAKEMDFRDVWVESIPTGEKARAGGLSFEGFPLPVPSEMRPLYLLGGGCIVAGVLLGWLSGWGVGLAFVGAGMTIIAYARFCDQYPLAGVIPLVAMLGAGAYLLLELYHGRSAREALAPVVQAIESAGQAGVAVKDKIVAAAGKKAPAVKRTILKVKEKLATA